MDMQTAFALTYPFAVGLAAFGSALGLGKAVSSAMESTGWQPDASFKILINMVVGCALIEALTIYTLMTVIFFERLLGG